MKVKLWLFLVWFIVFYMLIDFSFVLPNEYNGQSVTVLLRGSSRGFTWRLYDIGLWFLFSLIPYLVMVWFSPYKKRYCFFLLPIGLVVAYLLRFYMDRFMASRPIDFGVHIFRYSYFIVSFTLYSFIFFFIRYAQYKALQAKDQLLQNRKAELSFLRSQINPHFLFNSLNNIYALVFDNSEKSLTAIANLSDLLRYMIYESTEEVPLDREIDYIRKYVELQMLRFEVPVAVNLQISGAVGEVSFPPLLFIPFVENAFKHGRFNDEHGELLICIDSDGPKTTFRCRNKKGTQRKDSTGGIGIWNVKRRLQLLYPGRHDLHIEDKDDYFDVSLTILHAS